MANPYNDPRYELARLMRSQRGPSSVSPGPTGPTPSKASIQLGRAASTLSIQNPELRARIEAIASGKAQSERSGVMGAVFSNPITKTVLKPLEVLSIPGRATVAGLREVVDAIDGDKTTRASFSDFNKNVRDVSYGFGTAFNADTGNKWIDRAIGLAGDIVFDPLTYVTFGAGKFAGYTGRLDLAASVLAKTGDSQLANQVQRFGRAAIKDADVLERVGANRHGLYMFGKRLKVGAKGQGIRIPGSGAIGALGDNALAKLRISASRTKSGQWIQKMTLPAEGLAARQALLQGQVGDNAASALIGYFSAGPVARQAAGEALQREESLIANFFEKESRLGLDGYRKEIYKYLENPELLTSASPEIQRAAQQWNDVFKWYEGQVDEAIKAADPTYEFTPIERYFPRMMSDEAMDYRANAANKYSRSLNEIYARDPLEGGGNFKSRTLREGDDWFGHTLTKDDIASTERLNELAREHLNGADFFKTDIVEVMPQYVREFSKEAGVLARHKHLADTGFWKRAEEVSVTGEFIDKELVDGVRKEVRTLAKDLDALTKESSKAHLTLVNALEDYRSNLTKQLDELTGPRGSLGSKEILADAERAIDDVLNGALTLSADSLQTVADNLGSLKNRFAGLFDAEVTKGGKLVLKGTETEAEDAPMMIGGLVKYLDNLEADVQRLHDDMWSLEQDWTGDVLRAKYDESVKSLRLVEERFKEARRQVEEITKFGNQLESAIESILKGEDPGDLGQAVAEVLAVAGKDGLLSPSKTKELINKSFMREGFNTQQLVTEQTQIPDGVFKSVTQFADVNTKRVIKMSVKDFYDNLPRMFTGEMTMQQVREMGLWAILHDDVLYGAATPASLVRMRSELIQALGEADEAQAFFNAAVKNETAGGRLTSSKIFESQWKPAYMRAKAYAEESDSVRAWLESGEGAAIVNNPQIADMVVSPERIDEWVAKNPWLASLVPQTDANSVLEDLMGVNTPVGRITEDVFAGGDRITDQVYSGGGIADEITYGELVQKAEQRLNSLDSIMNGEFFSFGTGVGETRYTGNEVLVRYNEYRALRKTALGRQKERAGEYRRILKDMGYDKVDDSTSAGRARRAAMEEEARTRAAQRIEIRARQQNRVSDSELRGRINQLSGGNSTLSAEFMSGGAISQDDLAEKVINYMMVSDVSSRFNAVSRMLAPFGLVPTEKMFSTISQFVGARFLPKIDAHVTTIGRAQDILVRLDSEIAQALNNGVEGGETPHMIFKRFMTSLSKQEQDVLVDAIGYRATWGADPYELRRGLTDARAGKGRERVVYQGQEMAANTAAENEYYDKFVKPWFENAFPGLTPTKENMRKALSEASPSRAKTARRALLSPWGDSADARTIKRWFESIIGDSAIPGPSTRTVGYSTFGANMGQANASRFRLVNGSPELAVKLKSLRAMRNKFKAMLAPDANMSLFIEDPSVIQRTPTFYASLLMDQADDVERRIAERSGVASRVAGVEAEAGSVAQQAAQKRVAAANLSRGIITPELKKSIDDATAKVKAYEAYTAQVEAAKAAKKGKQAASIVAPPKPTAEEVRLASAGSTRRPAGNVIEGRRISQAEKQAEDTIDQYNTLMGSPKYSVAKADQEIVQAIEALSGYDMWKFTDGFTVDGEVFASFPDGRRITFSREEWESLFTGIRSERELAQRQAANRSAFASASAAVGPLRRRKEALEAVFDRENALYEQMLASSVGERASFVAGRNRRDFQMALNFQMEKVRQAKEALDNAAAEINKQLSVVKEFKLVMDSYSPATRAAALEKMRILVHGSNDVPAIFDQAGLRRFADFETPYQRMLAGAQQPTSYKQISVREYIDSTIGVPQGTASSRARALKAAWEASPEFATLRQMSELEQKMFVLKYKAFLDEADALDKYRTGLLSQLDSLNEELTQADVAVADATERAVRSSELSQAAVGENLGVAGPVAPPVSALSSPEELRAVASRVQGIASERPGRPVQPIDENALLRSKADEFATAEEQMFAEAARTNAAQQELADWSREAKAVPGAPKTSQEWLAQRQAGGPGRRQVLLKEATDAWRKRVTRADSTREVINALQDRQSSIRAEMAVASGSVDQFWRELMDGRSVAASLKQQIDEVGLVLDNMPDAQAFDFLKKASRGKATNEQIQTALQSYRSWIQESRPLFTRLAKEPDNPVYKAWAAAAVADSKLIDLELTRVDKINELYTASTPVWKTTVIQPLADEYEKAAREAGIYPGMTSLKGEGLGGLYGSEEAVELLRNIERIREPGVIDDMARFMRGYTGFFKSYATLSPGFHVRNSISNIFSIFSAGADISNMREGFRLWRLMDDHFSKGGTLESWIATLPAEQQELAAKAGRITLGLGGGKTDDALEAFAKEGSEGFIKNNAFIRMSRKAGHKVEGSARYMLAYDSLMKGMEDNVAFNRTHRYLIDYNQKTLLDNAMRDIVPFWTWMSRNLPLQIINRWTNPKAYLMYQKFYNNFNEEGDITPGYIANKMGINLGEDKYLTPDLPFTGINEQVEGFADPQKLMGYVNPGLRVPIEMLANKQFFSGREFGDKYVPLEGKFALLEPVFAAAGQLERNSQGKPMVREKAMYAMLNTVPFLGRMDRLIPSAGTSEERSQNAINSFLGIPYTQVDQTMKDSEQYRRLAQLQALQNKRKELE